MSSVESVRTARPAVAIQLVFVILSGLALSWLTITVPIPFLFAAFAAVVFCIVFLQRPDLGLLATLAVRPTTDVTIWLMGLTTQVGLVSFLTPNAGLILILVSCGAFYIVGRGVPFLSLPGGVLLVLFQLAGLVAILRAESVISSLNEWLAGVSTVIIYALAAYLFRTPRQIQRVIDVLAVSFVTPAIFGLQQFAHNYPGYRVNGTFVTAPGFGMYLVFILVVFVGQFFVHSGMRKFLAMGIVATSGVLLIATYTRGAWAGALAAVFVIAILRKRVLLVLVLIAVVFGARLIPSIDARLAEASGRNSTFADRQVLWGYTFREWTATTEDTDSSVATIVNRLLGLGPKGQILLTGRTKFGENMVAHDDYLRVLVNYGIFGLVANLLLTLVITVFAYRTWRRCTDNRLGAVALSVVALTIGYSIFSLTDNVFGTTYVQLPLWTLAGLTVAIAKLQPQGKAPRPTEQVT